jgi:hypothetical protein
MFYHVQYERGTICHLVTNEVKILLHKIIPITMWLDYYLQVIYHITYFIHTSLSTTQ